LLNSSVDSTDAPRPKTTLWCTIEFNNAAKQNSDELPKNTTRANWIRTSRNRTQLGLV